MGGKRTSYITKAECLTIQTPIVIMKTLGNHREREREREGERYGRSERGGEFLKQPPVT